MTTPHPRAERTQPTVGDEMKKCPFCAEMIQDEAVVCRYCGRQLNIDTLTPSAPLPTGGASAPNLDRFPAYYQDEFRRIYESNEQYTGKWNWAAFLFGSFWAMSKGLWPAAIVSLIVGFATGGLGFIGYWIVFGARGNFIYYSGAVKGRHRVF